VPVTPQSIFDRVAAHLLEQGERSFGPDGRCAYRGENGLKCGVGVLIADEHYSPSLEGSAVGAACVQAALERAGLNLAAPESEPVRELLWALQRVHDTRPPHTWQFYLEGLARQFGLSPSGAACAAR
jgi:hypothetical protein